MSELDLASVGPLASRIFGSAPGVDRWGWEYVDPEAPRPSPALRNEPHWSEPPGPDFRALNDKSAYVRSKAVKRGIILFLILTLVGIPHIGLLFLVVDLALAAVWFGPLLTNSVKAGNLRTQHQAERNRALAQFQQAHEQWKRKVADWNQGEQARVDEAKLWYPLRPRSGSSRVDVFGGTPESWAAVLVVMGASALRAGRPMLVFDMSDNDVAGPLSGLAQSQRLPVLTQELPAQLDQARLLGNLDPGEIAELIGEAFGTLRTNGDDVGLRMLDGDLLKGVAGRLDAPVTFSRLAAGLGILQGSYGLDGVSAELSAQEMQRLTEYVDVVGRGERALGEVQFLRSALDLLLGASAGHGTGGAGDLWTAGGLSILTSRDDNSRRRDLVDRLIVQALLNDLRRRRHDAADDGGVLVVAGADHLGLKTLEALADRARNAAVSLVLLIEHLRGDLTQFLGGSDSASIVMRLGNAQEASAAAEYIGRGYSFKLSQLSTQEGQTHTTGTSTTTGTSATTTESNGRSGGRAGGGWNQSTSMAMGESEQYGTNQSTANSVTDGKTVSRVYEFTVEPTQIQSLPAGAFVLVESVSGARRVIAGNCDPRIVTLPDTADGEYQGDSAQPAAAQTAAANGNHRDRVASVFIMDPGGQMHDMASSLARDGYVVRRVDVPGKPMECGWRVTSADGSAVSLDNVGSYR